jgi:hypothetical protein
VQSRPLELLLSLFAVELLLVVFPVMPALVGFKVVIPFILLACVRAVFPVWVSIVRSRRGGSTGATTGRQLCGLSTCAGRADPADGL